MVDWITENIELFIREELAERGEEGENCAI